MTGIVATIFLGVCLQVARSQDNFDQMHITWAPAEAENENAFKNIPLTPTDAEADGYTMLEDKSEILDDDICRYIKNDDPSNILLFRGDQFVGIQVQFPLSKVKNPESKWMNWFNNISLFSIEQRNDDIFYCLTALTVLTETDCEKKAGCGFWLVNNDKSLLEIPTTMPEDNPNGWVRNKCIDGMGRHYLWKISKTMDCMDFPAFFIIYKDQDETLNGIGFQAQSNFAEASPQFESPPRDASGFFYNVPDCLGPLWDDTEGINTIHIYINPNPSTYQCVPDK